MKRLIFDGNHLLHRISHVKQLEQISAPDGRFTGWVFGFLESVRNTANQFDPHQILVVFDAGLSARRKGLLPSYKDRMTEEDWKDPDQILRRETFRAQQTLIQGMLPILGVDTLRISDREADDIICAAAVIIDKDAAESAIIVSEDGDLLQLVSQSVTVHRPIQDRHVTLNNFKQVTGVPKDRFLLYKSILGDAGDCIPGIAGVGQKTAQEAAMGCATAGFGDLRDFCEQSKSARVRKIIGEGGMDRVLQNYDLVSLYLEKFTDEEMENIRGALVSKSTIDTDGTLFIFQKFGFKKAMERWDSWIAPFQRLR